MVDRTVEDRDPKKLKHHLLNCELYGNGIPDQDFLDSCKDRINVAIGILEDGTVIDGDRRMVAARHHQHKSVPVIVYRNLKDPLEIEKFLITANKHREKTTEQKAREFKRLLQIESEQAAKRLKATQPKPGERVCSKAVAPVPQPTISGKSEENAQKTRAADIAAEQVGLGRKSAVAAAEVVGAIDAAEESGDTETAEDLRTTLNTEGVKPASRKVKESREPKDKPILDGLGKSIPENLTEVFVKLKWFRATLSTLGTIRKEIEELGTQQAGAMLDVNDTLHNLRQLTLCLSAGKPFTECPECRRKVVKTCKLCRGHGFISKGWMNGMSDQNKRWLEGRK